MESLVINPGYLSPFEFEKYDFKKWNTLLTDHWDVSVYASAIYVTLVFVGQKWMESRKPFQLRGTLILWNISLTILSIIMFCRLYPELLDEIWNYGVYHSVCNRDEHTITTSFWIMIFTFSKILEFGDTAFIVLRKQKLMFLHWYHHISVACYGFYVIGNFDPSGRWFAVINSFIHTIMYGYYALKAMRIQVPKKFAMVLTSMQILQMVVGVFVNVLSFVGKSAGYECSRPYRNMLWAFIMYGSYFYLFVQFFKKAYGNKNQRKATD